jgi:hypothetical protein
LLRPNWQPEDDRRVELSFRPRIDVPRDTLTLVIKHALAAYKAKSLAGLERECQREARNAHGDLTEPADDGPDPFEKEEREAIQNEAPRELTGE